MLNIELCRQGGLGKRGKLEGDGAAGPGRWMEGIRGLTDKANGNK